jgi:hypothetical protein
MHEVTKFDPGFPVIANRIVSYLPLSHIAGLAVDVIA